jgi:hypothetical protein
MTMSIQMRVQPEGARANGARRGPLDSLVDMPTDLIQLSPAFLDALREVAPKVRPRRWRYFVSLVAVASLGIAVGRRIVVYGPAATFVHAPFASSSIDTASNATAPVVTPSAPAVERAPPLSAVADSLATRPGARVSDSAGAGPPNKAANHTSAVATAIAVDDLPRAATPNAKKNQRPQTPR